MPTDLRSAMFVASTTLLGLVAGCPGPEPTPEPPDAFRILRDGGPIDAFRPDAYVDDAPLPDAPGPDAHREIDAAVPRDVGTDAGSSSGVVVDGRLTEPAWMTAVERSTSETTFGPYAGTYLSRFLYLRNETELAIALQGGFPSETLVVAVYLDLSYPDVSDGVLLTPSGLGDRSGAVDSVLSNALIATDATFRPELGWGTGRRPESVTSGSATLGWRALSQTGAHTLLTAQRSACTTDTCETVVSLSALGVPAARQLGLVVRVGDSALLDSWAPLQTIPTDPDPEYVSVVEILAAVP